MIKLFSLIVLCLLIAGCKKDSENKVVKTKITQNKNLKDYIDFEYDEVIAFASVNPMDYYDGDFDRELNVKKFKDTVSRKLNPAQIRELNDILSGRKNQKIYSVAAIADCFYPRHNIIFLNKNKLVNHIVVCFECNRIKGSKPSLASMKNFRDFFNSLGLKVFDNPIEHSAYYDSIQLMHKKK
ncbi:hypothetical protein [Chryseobacterium shigense]|uniref:Uncharacterized protein n=1 Tax=Chryseobacterium shigense TaxID=297244 RepID=A0A841N9H7_9FLAO|nr:hypothetical protein [Chryseobacterium shigense]MBB6371351.1 hypothetical protein [Chryseobacterium shigense]